MTDGQTDNESPPVFNMTLSSSGPLPKRADLRPERTELRPERTEFRPEKAD